MWMLVHPTHLVLLSATLFQMRYLVLISDQKSCCFLCACLKSKTNFIPQSHRQKSCRRQTQCYSTLCGCLCTQPIWCCPLQPIQMRHFVVHFDPKSCYLCVPTTLAKHILFLNHINIKVLEGK